ncbi:hypothetical protein Tco_0520292 [Tanacetum coccineum]
MVWISRDWRWSRNNGSEQAMHAGWRSGSTLGQEGEGLDHEDLVLIRKKEISLDYNNSFLGEYEYSSFALDREEKRDEKKRFDHLKQDQTMIAGKIRGEVGGEGLVASIACEGDDKELVVMGEIGGGDGSEEGRL